jgi:hypothetical protein
MSKLLKKCLACDKKFKTGQKCISKKHCDNCQQEKLNCKFCQKYFNSKELLHSHIDAAHVLQVQTTTTDNGKTLQTNGIKLSSTKTDIDLDSIDTNLIIIKTLQSQLMENSDTILRLEILLARGVCFKSF